MKLTQDSIEALYFTAFGCYNQGKFEDATGYFRLLTTADPKTKKHWMGLGASLQMQKKFQRAIEAYEVAVALEPSDPYVHFHAAHCLQSLGNTKDALFALDCAKRALTLNPPISSLKNLLKHINLISDTLKSNTKKT